ncbi:MAG: NifB/NifX family molybdenum-iron cluster-binding protein [Melioribacteraceae bacterium]|nr:NifB/NifX family molybdenum-iron cluster-binding protein [Melioribacteraceae bacterium]
MKIIFTSKGKDWDSKIDPRFGRTEFILTYDTEKDLLENYDNSSVAEEAHGAGPRTAKIIYDLTPDVLITGNGPGNNAISVLNELKMEIYTGAENLSIKEALEAYKKGTLNKFNN